MMNSPRIKILFTFLWLALLSLCTSKELLCWTTTYKIPDEKALKDLDAYVTKETEEERFSGVILLAKSGISFYKKAYGLASRRFLVPNRVDTKFNIGSMNKMFTAVAIAQLVEDGKLSFNDPIGIYLDKEWITQDAGEKVKIHHLLTHTSGFGSFFNDKFFKASKELFRYVNDYKCLIVDEKIQFEPGSKFSYSNTGFMLLGAIVEKVTGQDYFDYIRENIYLLANMHNSDCFEMDKPVSNLAIGYGKVKEKDGKEHWENNLYKHSIRGGPAGGGFSTAEDLLNFSIAIRSNKLIKEEMLNILITEVPNTGKGSMKLGYGFIIQNRGKMGRIFGHAGGFFGISSTLDMYLNSSYTIVILSNCSGGLFAVYDKIQKILESAEADV